jgi:MFS family permease
MSPSSVSIAEYFRLARENNNFRKLWLAQIVSELGDWFYTLAIYSLLLQLTGRASSVALALVLQVLPQTFVGPLAGAINDRVSRRKVMIFADLMRMLIVGCMLLVRSASVVWVVYPLLVLETVMAAFFEPARNAIIPNITAEQDVILANTMASATWSFNLAVGSLLGGLVAALLGRDAVFILNALSFLLSALLISRMQFAEGHLAGAEPVTFKRLFDYSPMLDGVRYISRDRKLLAMVSLKGGLGILGTSWVLFPVLGQRILPAAVHIRPERAALFGMSLLMGARGLGALIGPLVATHWSGRGQDRLRSGVLGGFLLAGLGYVVLGQTHSIWMACLVVTVAHMGASIVWVFSTTLLQLNTDDRFRGRVFAADLGIAMLMIAIASWTAGQAIDHGIAPLTVASATGVAMLVPIVAWGVAMQMWRVQD